VNLSDFNKLAATSVKPASSGRTATSNYDGTVNLGDFNLSPATSDSARGSEVTPQDWSNLASSVPEPSSLLLTGVPALAGMRRRRSTRAC
jgi:hypothetical protein